MMNEFLSYGAGEHSTALLVLLKPQLVVFADTGDEEPETYTFLERQAKPFVSGYGGQFVTVRNANWSSLKEMAFHDRIVPARTHRWCSDKFKVRPIRRYLEENSLLPIVQHIGFDANEAHRAKPSGRDDIVNRWVLIERGFDRPACRKVNAQAGLTPRKSGCFYCPFKSKGQWIRLRRDHPPLFQIAVEMERNASNFDGGFYLAGEKPLEEYLETGRIRDNPAQAEFPRNPLEDILHCACYSGEMCDLPGEEAKQ